MTEGEYQMTLFEVVTSEVRRSRGAYFTPDDLAWWMSEWSVASHSRRVLEPSFGDGAFLRGLIHAGARQDLEILGVEKDRSTFERAVGQRLLDRESAICSDFMTVDPVPVDAVVGNPPFVRLRHLEPVEAASAIKRGEAAFGSRIRSSGSVWLPFLVHSVAFLRPGGRLALVLPFEITHVAYAKGIWTWLGARFGRVRLIRLHDRIFDDILQDVVLLLCEDRGSRTEQVEFETYRGLRDFFDSRAETTEDISIQEADSNDKPFARALLGKDLRGLIADKMAGQLVPVKEAARFSVGYVSGDKNFFHLDEALQQEHGLASSRSLVPTISSGRDLQGSGLYTSTIEHGVRAKLFLVDRRREDLTGEELRYVQHGERRGVSQRYKCRIRDPWWAVPGVTRAELILSVFSSTPKLLINDARLPASNSLLCGKVVDGTPEQFAASWYNSFTLLEAELNVHALGGGVLILIPGEVGRMRMVRPQAVTDAAIQSLHDHLRSGDTRAAYRSGDASVLQAGLNLEPSEIELIKEGIATLSWWRTRVQADDHPI